MRRVGRPSGGMANSSRQFTIRHGSLPLETMAAMQMKPYQMLIHELFEEILQ
jgi:hypothetical protein